jgi:hypothetical protein
VNGPARRRSGRRPWSGHVAERAEDPHRPGHGRGHGRRRRGVLRATARRVRRPASGRPADGPGRAVRRQLVGPAPGAMCCSTGSVAKARWPATRWATCSSSPSGTSWRRPSHGLDLVGRLLDARGRVLPMAANRWRSKPTSSGTTRHTRSDVTFVRGQHRRGLDPGTGRGDPAATCPAPRACPESIEAIDEADWVILGPGSWFTSVLPHVLVPDLCREALESTSGPPPAQPQPRHVHRGDQGIPGGRSPGPRWLGTRPTCGWMSSWPTRASS